MPEKPDKKNRYFVPDLTPMDRSALQGVRFRYVFIAESPHVSEVAESTRDQRRPLCGSAGKVWWSALGEILEGKPWDRLSSEDLIRFCRKHRIAVMNAVQFPLDEKIVDRLETSEVDPMLTLGFSKTAGASHYKKAKEPDRSKALSGLRGRLLDPALSGAKLVALGNDSDWFIRHALSPEELQARSFCKIAHPSAWWRRGGYFGKQARMFLGSLFAS